MSVQETTASGQLAPGDLALEPGDRVLAPGDLVINTTVDSERGTKTAVFLVVSIDPVSRPYESFASGLLACIPSWRAASGCPSFGWYTYSVDWLLGTGVGAWTIVIQRGEEKKKNDERNG